MPEQSQDRDSLVQYLFKLCAYLLGAAMLVMMLVYAVAEFSEQRSNLKNTARFAGQLLIANIEEPMRLQNKRILAGNFRSLNAHPLINSACLYNISNQLLARHSKPDSIECPTQPAEGMSGVLDDYLLISESVEWNSQKSGLLQLYSNQNIVWSHLLELLAGFAVTAIILFLAVLVLGKRLGNRATTGLDSLMESANQISEGDFSVRFDERGPGEVREVASAFNTIVDRISEATQATDVELAQHHRTQHALMRTESLLRNIIDLVPYLIFAVSKEGKMEFTNRAVAEAYGTSPTTLMSGQFQSKYIGKKPDGLIFSEHKLTNAPQEIW